MSQIRVKDPNGVGLVVPLRFADEHGTSESALFDCKTNDDGSQNWPIWQWSQTKGYTLHVNTGDYRNPAYSSDSRYLAPGDTGDQDFTLQQTGVSVPTQPRTVSRLHVDGSNLVNEQGQRALLSGATFFAGLWLYLQKGETAIRPSLDQLTSRWGVNCVLTFGMSVNVQRNLFAADAFNPRKYPNYWDAFRQYHELLASYGVYDYFVAGPDHGLILGLESQDAFRAFWNELLDAAASVPNLLLKPTNEGFRKDYNFVDVNGLRFPDFCPAAATDYGPEDDCWNSGTYPRFADWGGSKSCGDIHPPRTGTSMDARECIALNNVYYTNHRPLFISEALRLGSNGSAGATREMARLIGAASNVGPAMRICHTLAGEMCAVFDDFTADQADAYFTGV